MHLGRVAAEQDCLGICHITNYTTRRDSIVYGFCKLDGFS